MNAGTARAAGAALLVVLALTGCGRVADRTDGAAVTSGASSTDRSPATGEDGATPTSAVTGPAATDVAELQQALDAADRLAEQVDQDMAADGS